jgi:hypothetical protein
MENKQSSGGRAELISRTANAASKAAAVHQLINAIVSLILFLAFAAGFAYIGVPWYFCLGIAVIAFIFFAVSIIRYRRIITALGKTDSTDADEAAAEADDIVLEPDEILVDTIPAVMRYGATRSVNVLGVGVVRTPENALLITNKAVWALTVPMPGQHQVISGADVGQWQWMTAYKEIADKLQDMVSSMPLQALLEQCSAKRLMGLPEIKRARTLPMTYAISLMRSDKKKFGYSVRTQEDFLKAKRIFGIN